MNTTNKIKCLHCEKEHSFRGVIDLFLSGSLLCGCGKPLEFKIRIVPEESSSVFSPGNKEKTEDKMESLFLPDKNFAYTELAVDIEDSLSRALYPIIERWTNLGYSPRELEYIGARAVEAVCLGILLDWHAEGKH